MQRYINHLLADIEAATRHAPASGNYHFSQHLFDDEDGHNERARYTRLVCLGEHLGVPAEAFPPAERLKKDQVKALLTALEGLWRAWRVSWHCPSGLRARRRYTLMTAWMARTNVPYHVDFGADIDFCADRDTEGCPFGADSPCTCALHEEQCREIGHWQPPDYEPEPLTPSEELNEWLQADRGPTFPWQEEDDDERYRRFMADEDMMAWLYFYRPQWNTGLPSEPLPDDPSEYEDFDWEDDGDGEDVDLPF